MLDKNKKPVNVSRAIFWLLSVLYNKFQNEGSQTAYASVDILQHKRN